MPNSQPSLNQVLLSLLIHRKTGSRDVIDLLNVLGYGIPYTEVLFIEDMWAEWDRKMNSNIPTNMSKNVPTTLVADNIDWKNKSITGTETHHTNRILVQHQTMSANFGRPKVYLEADYSFDRKKHKAFKSLPYSLPNVYFKKCPAKLFDIDDTASLIRVQERSVIASKETIAWILRRMEDKENKIPAWSAYQSMTSLRPKLCEVNVGYMSSIPASPTKYEVNYRILETAEEVMHELELDHI